MRTTLGRSDCAVLAVLIAQSAIESKVENKLEIVVFIWPAIACFLVVAGRVYQLLENIINA